MSSNWSQGGQANLNGHLMESNIENTFKQLGYTVCTYKDYQKNYINNDRIVIKQYPFINEYGGSAKMDFYVIDKVKGITQAVEVKTQLGAGSVDEKLIYVYFNLRKIDSKQGVLVTVGNGFKSGAISWFKNACDNKFLLESKPDKSIMIMSIGDYLTYILSGFKIQKSI